MKLLSLVFFYSFIASHDIQVAFFTIHQDDEKIYIDFVLEMDDVTETFRESGATLTNTTLQEYLQDNFSISCDHIAQRLEYSPMQIEDKHVRIKGQLLDSPPRVGRIDVHNTCLLNIDDHSNILELRLLDQERDFLMNSDRTSLHINL